MAELLVPTQLGCLALKSIRRSWTPPGPGLVWTQLILPQFAHGTLLSLCNTGPWLKANQILCIHDVNTYLAPESYSRLFRTYYQHLLPALARRVRRVVTVSQFSATMLAQLGFCARQKISVIPNGHEHALRWQAARSTYYTPRPRPYVFVLGSQAKHKNVQTLLQLAGELDRLGVDLLVAGMAEGRIFQGMAKVSPAPNVHLLGFVTDDDLAALYHNALCLAFPSLTEGFGTPVVEAMALGCPVISVLMWPLCPKWGAMRCCMLTRSNQDNGSSIFSG